MGIKMFVPNTNNEIQSFYSCHKLLSDSKNDSKIPPGIRNRALRFIVTRAICKLMTTLM